MEKFLQFMQKEALVEHLFALDNVLPNFVIILSDTINMLAHTIRYNTIRYDRRVQRGLRSWLLA